MTAQPTCGHGLAEHALLHERFSALVATMADNLELHLTALDPADAVSAPEHAAYSELVEQHRDLAARLAAVADQMASYRGLPMANHDPAVMSGKPVMMAFEKLIDEQEALLRLLERWIKQDRAMLDRFGDA